MSSPSHTTPVDYQAGTPVLYGNGQPSGINSLNGDVFFHAFITAFAEDTTFDNLSLTVPTDMIIRNIRLRITLNQYPVDAIIQFFVNGSPVNLIITIPAGDEGLFENLVDPIRLNKGDKTAWSLLQAATGGQAIFIDWITMESFPINYQ